MWMSNASRSFLTYIQDPRYLSHLHPCTVSPPSRYQHYTKAPIYVPHLHLGRVSPPCRAHLTSIQISRIASQHHLTLSRSQNVHSISIQVWSYTHPGLENLCLTSLQAPTFMSPIHQLHASPQSRSIYIQLTTIHLLSHFHPGPCICISPPSMAWCVCLPPPGCLSLPSMSGELYLTSTIVPSQHIQVSGCASQLNPGPFSTPSRSRDLCLISIQAPRFTSPLHPSWVSPQSRSLYLHLAYIQANQIAS